MGGNSTCVKTKGINLVTSVLEEFKEEIEGYQIGFFGYV